MSKPTIGDKNSVVSIKNPFGYSPSDWLRIFKRAGLKTVDTDMSLRCAGTAFFIFISLFPAIGAALAIAGLIMDTGDIDMESMGLSDVLPVPAVNMIDDQIDRFLEREISLGIGLAISIVAATWAVTRAVGSLVHSVNKAYEEEDSRNFVQALGLSFIVGVATAVTLGLMIFAITILPAMLVLLPLPINTENLVLILRWPIIVVTTATGLFFLYRETPDRVEARTPWVLPGTVVATFAWVLGTLVFSFYIENFGRYEATFGSIAAVVIFILWINYTATIFIFGAALNAEIEWANRRDTTVGKPKPMGQRGAVVADTFPSG